MFAPFRASLLHLSTRIPTWRVLVTPASDCGGPKDLAKQSPSPYTTMASSCLKAGSYDRLHAVRSEPEAHQPPGGTADLPDVGSTRRKPAASNSEVVPT